MGWSLSTLAALLVLGLLTVGVGVGLLAASGGDARAAGAASLVLTLGGAAVQAVLVTGLLRLTLRPEQPGFLHLRAGRDELRSAGVILAYLLGAAVLAMGGVLAALALQALSPLAPVAAFLGLGLLWTWLAARFSLALPASFVRGRIDLASSWRLTRRRGWALAGMWMLTIFLVLLVSLAAWLALILVSLPFVGWEVLASLAGRDAFEDHPRLFLLHGAAQILFLPVQVVLSQAPAVAAYQALAERRGG